MIDQLAFSPEWLTLREPADQAARSAALAEALAGRLPPRRSDTRLAVLDLATGTGANLRALAPRFRRPQDWMAVDLDTRLLDALHVRTREWAAANGWEASVRAGRTQVRGTEVDLAVTTARFDLRDLSRHHATDTLPEELVRWFDGRALVTASALLDLLSERQVRSLARLCRHAGAAVFFALTYDGRITCTPHEPEDETVRGLVNRHQRTDKGFGPALGPDATAGTSSALVACGYDVRVEPSDWTLGPESPELQRQLLAGWASAAEEIAPEQSAALRAWFARRLAHVDGGRSRMVVGHRDVLATI